jgi:hypothetical protein
MANAEEKREFGASLVFIGFALWVAGLLVVFYLPASMKIGHQSAFLGIIVALFACGLAAMISGYRRWTRANEAR